MAEQSVVSPDPAGLPIGANPAQKAGPSNTKRRRIDNQEMFETFNTLDYTFLFRPTSDEVTEKLCTVPEMVSRPCPVPNVALEDFYKQMKLGVESFSSWWKKKFPEGTCEGNIQRAFEMYRLSVTQADLVQLMVKHARHVPFTLSDDLEAKRKELIDALHHAQKISMQPHCYSRSLQAEEVVSYAQAALVHFSTEYMFWHTMSRFRPTYMVIGAGAVSPGARDTPDEAAFQIPRSVYLEKARLGSAEFEAWFKRPFQGCYNSVHR